MKRRKESMEIKKKGNEEEGREGSKSERERERMRGGEVRRENE